MFSDDGTLERLGVRAIYNHAGVAALAHNLAAEKKIDPFVSVRFKCGDEMSQGSRKAMGTARPRPAIADAVLACFTVNPLVRGHALRRFWISNEIRMARLYDRPKSWLHAPNGIPSHL